MGVLGPMELQIAGEPVVVTGAKQRSLLVMLALHANQAVSVGALVDAMWGDPAPVGAEHTLQQHVSATRKLLHRGRTDGAADAVLSRRSPGYLLRVESLDVDEFERAASVGFDAARGGRWPDANAAFDSALAHWRGPALADVRDSARLSAAAVRLDEQRLTVMEGRFDARLECGQAREVIPEIEEVIVDYPLRERLHAQLMLALYRTGRQAEALVAYQAARHLLIDELGIEPGGELNDLEQAILQQSPALAAGAVGSIGELHATFRADTRTSSGRVELPDGQAIHLAYGSTLIGRDPVAHVRLVDNRVSRHHARIDTTAKGAVLRDLASTNGTSVNGKPVSECVLRDGDVIGIEGIELRFYAADA